MMPRLSPKKPAKARSPRRLRQPKYPRPLGHDNDRAKLLKGPPKRWKLALLGGIQRSSVKLQRGGPACHRGYLVARIRRVGRGRYRKPAVTCCAGRGAARRG